jgi:hypothetical protein
LRYTLFRGVVATLFDFDKQPSLGKSRAKLREVLLSWAPGRVFSLSGELSRPRMVSREGLRRHFHTRESRFHAYESHFYTYETRFHTYESHFYTYESCFHTHESRFYTYENRFHTYESHFYTYENRFHAYENRFYTYENRSRDHLGEISTIASTG